MLHASLMPLFFLWSIPFIDGCSCRGKVNVGGYSLVFLDGGTCQKVVKRCRCLIPIKISYLIIFAVIIPIKISYLVIFAAMMIWQFGDVESGSVCTKASVSYANQRRMRNSMKIQIHKCTNSKYMCLHQTHWISSFVSTDI